MQILKAFSERVMFNLFKTKSSILIAIMCVVAVGCSDDIEDPKQKFIGTWEYSLGPYTRTWTLNKNETFIIEQDLSGEGKYSFRYGGTYSIDNYIDNYKLIFNYKWSQQHNGYVEYNDGEPSEHIIKYGKDNKGEYIYEFHSEIDDLFMYKK